MEPTEYQRDELYGYRSLADTIAVHKPVDPCVCGGLGHVSVFRHQTIQWKCAECGDPLTPLHVFVSDDDAQYFYGHLKRKSSHTSVIEVLRGFFLKRFDEKRKI